ncbi:MAG TPA: arsenate reductase ArsC [Devosiaceae bacterium]
MEDKVYNVLFLCTGNSARSIMGEALLDRMGRGRFKAYSAGSFPRGEVHPMTLTLLRELGYDVGGLRSKSWEEFSGPGAPQMDFVFTVCDQAANEPCPIWPGHPVSAHWGVPDPAAAEGDAIDQRFAFVRAYRALERRISVFVELPIDGLNRLALKEHVDAIGRQSDPA